MTDEDRVALLADAEHAEASAAVHARSAAQLRRAAAALRRAAAHVCTPTAPPARPRALAGCSCPVSEVAGDWRLGWDPRCPVHQHADATRDEPCTTHQPVEPPC